MKRAIRSAKTISWKTSMLEDLEETLKDIDYKVEGQLIIEEGSSSKASSSKNESEMPIVEIEVRQYEDKNIAYFVIGLSFPNLSFGEATNPNNAEGRISDWAILGKTLSYIARKEYEMVDYRYE